MELTQWTSTGAEGVYDFEHQGRTGWAHRDNHKCTWRVTISGVDGAFREVSVPLARGRTLKSAIRDALRAWPHTPRPQPDSQGRQNYGDFVGMPDA